MRVLGQSLQKHLCISGNYVGKGHLNNMSTLEVFPHHSLLFTQTLKLWKERKGAFLKTSLVELDRVLRGGLPSCTISEVRNSTTVTKKPLCYLYVPHRFHLICRSLFCSDLGTVRMWQNPVLCHAECHCHSSRVAGRPGRLSRVH